MLVGQAFRLQGFRVVETGIKQRCTAARDVVFLLDAPAP